MRRRRDQIETSAQRRRAAEGTSREKGLGRTTRRHKKRQPTAEADCSIAHVRGGVQARQWRSTAGLRAEEHRIAQGSHGARAGRRDVTLQSATARQHEAETRQPEAVSADARGPQRHPPACDHYLAPPFPARLADEQQRR
ncbi:unnamed protein product [Prorocentrum cordatum]|uniref:Uncharacterized protein n=1 Tax=Prorocentrum cordatum TaxID=2364126 RepID=A0ABN9TV24_9DINO|nr:unnamed protein product [Polarella glacialis]